MELWVAAVLCIACAGGTAAFIVRSRRHKNKRHLALAVVMAVLALVLLMYTGLTFLLVDRAGAGPNIGDSARNTPDTGQTPEDESFMVIDTIIEEAIGIVRANPRPGIEIVPFPYEQVREYDRLNETDKAMYDEMLEKAQRFIPFAYTAAEHGYDVMDQSLRVYGALIKDHSEIENYFIMGDVVDGDRTVSMKARYFMPWDAETQPADTNSLGEEVKRFDAICQRIVGRIPEGLSVYDQYRYLATVISLTTSYDYDATGGWQDATAYGAIVGGYSVCQGYSRGFLYLCQKAGLWCQTVDGVAGENTSHMWNMVKLDSGTYHVDITWCDELGFPGTLEWETYFMLTQDEILNDHEITDGKVATGTQITG